MFQKTITIIALLAFGLSACQSSENNASSSNASENIATAAYDCPMKCEGAASDKPGKCPKCEMDLVATAK